MAKPTIQTAALSVPGLVALANVAYGSLHFLVTPAVLVWLILGVGAGLAPDPRLGILRGDRSGDE